MTNTRRSISGVRPRPLHGGHAAKQAGSLPWEGETPRFALVPPIKTLRSGIPASFRTRSLRLRVLQGLPGCTWVFAGRRRGSPACRRPVGPGRALPFWVLPGSRGQGWAAAPAGPRVSSSARARQPVFLLATDPPPLIGTLFLWPLCLRNGLKSPADWPKSCLPPGGRADATCLYYGTYLSLWTSMDVFSLFASPSPPLPLPRPHSGTTGTSGSPSGHGRWNSNGVATPRASLEGWACGLSAVLVRNNPHGVRTDTPGTAASSQPQGRPQPVRPAARETWGDPGRGYAGGHHPRIGRLYIGVGDAK